MEIKRNGKCLLQEDIQRINKFIDLFFFVLIVELGLMLVMYIVIFFKEFFLELIIMVCEFVGFIVIELVNGVISYKLK